MKLGLRSRIVLVALGLVMAPTSLGFLVVRRAIEAQVVESTEADLHRRLQLGLVTSPTWPEVLVVGEAWQRAALSLGRASEARVTLIRRDGLVLGDSELADGQVPQARNHRLRPEIQTALRGELGMARRQSHTTGRELLYMALPFGPAAEPVGVLRMAIELGAVEQAVGRFEERVALGLGAALLVTLVMAGLSAAWASRGTRQLTAMARRMTDGDLEVLAPAIEQPDLAELGRALERLAKRLSTLLGELRAERDWMGGVLARMREGVLLLDAEQRIQMVNPALCDMLMISAEVVGRPLLDTIRYAPLKRLVEKAVETDAEVSERIEIGGLRPRQLLVRAAPLGAEQAVFAVVLDLTEMRRLEAMRREFAANVSHELRTPVASIRSAAETIRDVAQKDTAALPGFADIIVRHAERLGLLIDDLLELSRIESREFRVTMQPVDIGAVLKQAAELFEERIERQRQTLRVEVPSSLPRVLADPRALDRVVMNLIDNAVKYSGADAVIRVVAVAEEHEVRVSIEDTGPGIGESHLTRIFERFYRVDTGRSREQGGTGLGLSIVKHLCEAMGSRILVDSTLGVGTKFSFTLRAT